ncbi:MAG: DegV family EDD domain-containing protein [Candidatus Heimdallarchaeota archaeon]|nr:DegV family EDD domain-containing protein [Candidatus Heimdallarchaeota archaeon]
MFLELNIVSKIVIVSDGSCDLPRELVEQYNIHIIPFKVIFGEEVYRTYGDWGTITKEQFYNKLQSFPEFPTTSVPSPIMVNQVLGKALEQAETVIAILLSRNFSSLYQMVVKLSEKFESADISVVDSGVATSSLGALVLEAAKMATSGASKEEILHRLDQLIPQARLLVVLDSVDAVYHSGRVGWAKKFLVSSLRIKPIVNFRDGLIVPGGTLRGRKEVIKRLKFVAPIVVREAITDTVFIWHVRFSSAAQELKELMERNNEQNKNIIVQEAGPIVGSHVGEKSIGYMYIGPYKKQWILKMKE